MRIVRYLEENGSPRFGSVGENGLVYALQGDPLTVYQIGSPVGELVQLHLLAPCQPTKVIGIAINYQGATGVVEGMQEPLVFLKPGTSVCGPGDSIICPFPDIPVWGEAELAIVVKKTLRNVLPEQVRDGILGFTVANDVSAQNIAGRDHHLARSKGADTFCPFGPWIDTDYNPSDQLVEAFQNSDLIRRGRISERIWDDTQIVSWLSTWVTLEPWDVILTGTPPRVVPRCYLNEGDQFVARIEGLGTLTNTFHRRV